MDDFLLIFKTQAEAEKGKIQLLKTLDFLGLKMNEKKSHLTPTQTLDHLGLTV